MPVLSSEGSGVANHASLLQISSYVGMNIANILYGIELFLYFKTIQILLVNEGTRKKKNLFYMLFSSVMLLLITVWVATEAIFGQYMWLVRFDYPGGPDAYMAENLSVWYMSWAMTGVIVLQLMTDALMIYRCWLIWNCPGTIIPIILWLATLALGLSVDAYTCAPRGFIFNGVAKKLGLAYYAVSIFLNTMLTCKICYHIMRHARDVQKHIGPEHASLYFTALTIIIESVFPYTLSGIAFLVSLGVVSGLSSAFMCVYFLMMCISPQMLILRVIKGKALDADTFKQPSSTIQFSPGSTLGSQPFEGDEARVYDLQTLPKAYSLDGHAEV